jgi:menaquinone-dependent protoporphyrinogen oxidase
MENNVLVAFATKHGATKEIAEKIGAMLRQAGLSADVIPVGGVRDLNSYMAVILGSAVYVGKWQGDAEKFLQANEKILADRPVWLFSSGPTGEGDPLELVEGQRMPVALKPIVERIRPRDVTVFHGNINLEKLNFMEKWAIKNVAKKPFGDYRDWEAIESWSDSIAEALKKTAYVF